MVNGTPLIWHTATDPSWEVFWHRNAPETRPKRASCEMPSHRRGIPRLRHHRGAPRRRRQRVRHGDGARGWRCAVGVVLVGQMAGTGCCAHFVDTLKNGWQIDDEHFFLQQEWMNKYEFVHSLATKIGLYCTTTGTLFRWPFFDYVCLMG